MANLYDLKRFDLNLLVIFECIYQQLSISKAAEMLFITPSAVSQSLQRLRTQLNDPLFIRAGKGITPTTVATNLHHHLAENLNSIEQTINLMNNSGLNKRFVIYGPQFYCSPKFMGLMDDIMSETHVQIEYHDYAYAKDSIEDLMNYRKADIVLSLAPINNRALICTPFLQVDTVLACSKNHPRLGDTATIEEALSEKFTQFMTSDPNIIQYQHRDHPFYSDRQIAFYSSSMMSIINTIKQTDIIGMIPSPFYELFKDSMELKKVGIPVDMMKLELYIIYNRSMLNSNQFKNLISKITA